MYTIYSRTIKSDHSCYQITTLYAMSYKQMKERINRSNEKLKELVDENDWNATTCIIQLKSAFVLFLAFESGLHWRFALHNSHSSICNELQIHDRINRNNQKLKDLNENDWNTTTCTLIRLKSAFVLFLAFESGLHWRFELHNNYSICNELQTHERINRNNKKFKELDENGWNQIRCIIHSRRVIMIMSSHFILIQTDPKAAPIISESAINTSEGKAR